MVKSKAYIIAFLAFCVLSSKNIIIYNEETLVVLTFLAFVFFIFHYYGNTIQDSLNERGSTIKSELQNLGIGQLDSLDQLNKEHQKVSVLNGGLTDVNTFTMRELLGAKSRGSLALNTIFFSQLEQKLKTVSLFKLAIQQKLQQFMAKSIFGLVHVLFPGSKKKN